MKAIEIKNLNYFFKSDWTYKKTQGLKNISLEVIQGESFGFLGQNGAGKTTTIKCLLGLLQSKSEKMQIYEQDSKDAESRRLVGYVPEQPYFYDNLKVIELLKMYAGLSGVKENLESKCINALTRTGIVHKKDAFVRNLSKGQTQRVAIAQAIVHEPKLLILDEPFSGLDPVGRREIFDLFSELKKSGTTIFICSHILNDIENLCDRVSIMARGEILGIYDLKDLPKSNSGKYEIQISNYENLVKENHLNADIRGKFAYFSFDNYEDAKKLAEKIFESEAHLEKFDFHGISLEQLFISLIRK